MATNAVSPLIGKAKKRKVHHAAAPVKRKRRKPAVAKTMVRRKRRKVSGIGDELPKIGEMILAASAGAFVGRMITNLKVLAPANSTATDYRGYICIAAGAGLMLGIKNPIAKSAGLGMATLGINNLIPDSSVPQIGAVRMVGSPKVITLGNGQKNNRPRMIAGNTTSPLVGGMNRNRNRNTGGLGG